MNLRDSYSDFGQDTWVMEDAFGEELAAGYRGFFIEAGAADGVGASNTYLLEKKHGWTGILVEPNRHFFQRLPKARSARCFNVALSDQDSEIEFIESGYLGVAVDHVREKYRARGQDLYADPKFQWDADGSPAPRTMLRARSLRSLLAETGAPTRIDYFSLDVEGGELAVLQGFPFDTHRVRALTIETRFPAAGRILDHVHRAPCRGLLESHGYELVRTMRFDDCYRFRG